jgi:hypothetical protein
MDYQDLTQAELDALPVLEFEEVFGCQPGDKRQVQRYPSRTASQYFIKFKTPNHSEDDLRFFPGGFPFVTNVDLSIWEGSKMLYERPGSNRRHLSCFVALTNEDPRVGRKSGHPYIPAATARVEWLKPNTTYKLLVYRFRHSDEQPISLYYYGNDVDQVDYADVPAPQPVPTPGTVPSYQEGISLDIAGVKGMWFQTPE